MPAPRKPAPRKPSTAGRRRATAGATVSIVLVDDHAVVLQGLRALLQSESDLVVVGEAGNGRRAVELVERLNPDVVVMDIAMPRLNGLEATRQIVRLYPEVAVVILSAHADPEYIERARELGVAAYVLKESPLSDLATAIRSAKDARGGIAGGTREQRVGTDARGRESGARGSTDVPSLTVREAEVLQLIAEGWANKQSAAELGISIKTIEKHRQSVMAKLDIHDVAGLTRFAISLGIIEGRDMRPTP